MDTPSRQLMQCMEVWGGNQVVESGVVMAGLDAWVYSKPFGDADGGGDVYYVSSCATGRITRLLVADVSGHGSAVCDVAGQLRSLMRRYVNHLSQREFVKSMNRQFGALAQNGCFATALVTTFFAPTNHLSLCNAGHPPPLLYRAETREWSFMDPHRDEERRPTNIPLGILDLSDYAAFDVRLGLGDLVLCYTDSLLESGDGTGELLGMDGLLKAVRAVDVTDPARFTALLLAHIAAVAPGNLTADDVTVLLFRPNGLGERSSPRTKLLAPLRVARGVFSSLFPGGAPAPWPELSLVNIGGAVFDRLNRRVGPSRRGRP